jgi:hypothetical protein
MASSGAKPGRLPESALAIQIDTIQFHLGAHVSHGLPRFFHSFNRTVVATFPSPSCYFDLFSGHFEAKWEKGANFNTLLSKCHSHQPSLIAMWCK